MANVKAKSGRRRGGGGGRAAGRLRVRTRTSARRVTLPETAEVRELRERIDAAVSQGEEVRREILARIDRALELPPSAVSRRTPRSRRG